MASITNRKDSSGNTRWLVRVRRLGVQPITKTFDTKADAERFAREIER